MLPSLARLSLDPRPPPTGVPDSISTDDTDERRIRVLKRVESGKLSLIFAPNEFRDDRDVVLAAVENDGNELEWASVTLRADRDIVLAAVRETAARCESRRRRSSSTVTSC